MHIGPLIATTRATGNAADPVGHREGRNRLRRPMATSAHWPSWSFGFIGLAWFSYRLLPTTRPRTPQKVPLGNRHRTQTREPKGLVMPYLIGVAIIIVTLAFLLLETFRLYGRRDHCVITA